MRSTCRFEPLIHVFKHFQVTPTLCKRTNYPRMQALANHSATDVVRVRASHTTIIMRRNHGCKGGKVFLHPSPPPLLLLESQLDRGRWGII